MESQCHLKETNNNSFSVLLSFQQLKKVVFTDLFYTAICHTISDTTQYQVFNLLKHVK